MPPSNDDKSNVLALPTVDLDTIRARLKVDGRGGPPDDGSMNERIARLEAILPTLATKADIGETNAKIAESKFAIIAWLGGALIAVTALILSVMANMLKAGGPAPTAPQPIVIQMPSQAPVSATPAPKSP